MILSSLGVQQNYKKTNIPTSAISNQSLPPLSVVLRHIYKVMQWGHKHLMSPSISFPSLQDWYYNLKFNYMILVLAALYLKSYTGSFASHILPFLLRISPLLCFSPVLECRRGRVGGWFRVLQYKKGWPRSWSLEYIQPGIRRDSPDVGSLEYM